MIVDFYTHGYTELRYLLPIAERVGRQHTMRAFVNRRAVKYNSVISLGDQRMRELFSQRGVELMDDENPSGGDALFSVEGVSPYTTLKGDYERIINLQHAFDYHNPQSHLDPGTINVMWDSASADQIREMKGDVPVYIPRVPVAFWNSGRDRKFAIEAGVPERSVLLYYPDQGYTDHARDVSSVLIDLGVLPIIKQRAKHQRISSVVGTSEVYDKLWYPSESIFLALSGMFCVGFGTGAYADICAAGIGFLDFSLPDYSKKYAKPVGLPCFVVGDLDKAREQVEKLIAGGPMHTACDVSDSDVCDFFMSTVGEDLR